MSKEYYKKYRPRRLESVVGQEGALSSLQRYIKDDRIPQSLLFSGPSGTGKTTLARILAFEHLKCMKQDYTEINAAECKGIDMVREIARYLRLRGLSGGGRVWCIDEAHKLTGDAQNALLKHLEDTPRGSYFMLCTTDPQKLIKTIHTRCAEIKLMPLGRPHITKLLKRVIHKENLRVDDKVVEEIVDVSDSSGRKALVILDQVGKIEGSEKQMEAIAATTLNKDLAIALARNLINPGVKWPEVAKLLKTLEDDPESIRYLVLGYCRSVMLSGGNLSPRAYMIVDIFSRNFYDSKHAGLAAACWEVVHAR